MGRYLFFVQRALHRTGIGLMAAVVLMLMVLEWMSEIAHVRMRILVRLAGLARLEEWLRRQSLYFGLVIVVPILVFSVLFKIYEVNLVRHHYFMRALAYGLAFKIIGAGVINYFLHLYADHLLEVAWIAHWYGYYRWIRLLALEYVKSTSVYQRALRLKHFLAGLAKHRSLFATAQRFARTKNLGR